MLFYPGVLLRLKLTDKNRQFWEQCQEKDVKFIRDLFSGMNEEETSAMAGSIQKLNSRLEEWGSQYGSPEAEE